MVVADSRHNRRTDLVDRAVVRVVPGDRVVVASGRWVVADSFGRAEPESTDPGVALADSLAGGIRAVDIGRLGGRKVGRRQVVEAVDRTVG